MYCIDLGVCDEVKQLVGAVLADKCVDTIAFRKHDGLEAHVHLLGKLQVLLDFEFLIPAVFFTAQNDGERFSSACLEFVQVVDVQFLEHRGDNTRNAGKVCSECVKETLHDNRVLAIGLDVERNDGRAGGVRDIGMALFVVVDEATVNGMDISLGIASRDCNSRFVVRFEVVEVKTDLVAFDAGEHAVADERFRVAAVVTETVKLGLANAPAAGFEELCRRRTLAGGPVAVAHKAFEYLGLFATDFLDPRVFAILIVCEILVECAEEFKSFGTGGLFVHAVETALHQKIDQVAFGSAL